MTKPLEGRTALVTGASRGIGAATAKALAAAGAHVVITARSAQDLEAVEEAIHQAGGTATIAPLDLAENDSIAKLAHALRERFTGLDILILNAGMLGTLGPVAQIDMKEFAKLLTLNVTAQVALLSAFDPMLKRSGRGRVIGVTSSVGATPRAYWGAYGASKAALENLLLSYGAEVANVSKTRVAVLDPGATRTKMRERAYPGEAPESVKPPEVVADRIVALLTADFETGLRERVEA